VRPVANIFYDWKRRLLEEGQFFIYILIGKKTEESNAGLHSQLCDTQREVLTKIVNSA
jgi:hypothetical protein